MKFISLIEIGLDSVKYSLFKHRTPLFATFAITYRCNSHCKYCDVIKIKKREMTTKQIFSMLLQFKKIGLKRITFSGGEPLLRNDIGEIIDYSKKLNIYTILASNGSLLKEKINELKNLDTLTLSLDGTKNVNDNLRGKGSFDKVTEAIKISKKHKIQTMILSTISKYNLEDIDNLLNMVKELEVPILFQPIFNYYLSSSINKMGPVGAKYQKIIRKIINTKKTNKYIASSKIYFNYIYDYPTYNRSICKAAKLFCAIDPEGYIYPCYALIGKTKALNGNKVGFKKAFFAMPQFKCSCDGCCVGQIENNLVFSYNLPVIFNDLKYIYL